MINRLITEILIKFTCFVIFIRLLDDPI